MRGRVTRRIVPSASVRNYSASDFEWRMLAASTGSRSDGSGVARKRATSSCSVPLSVERTSPWLSLSVVGESPSMSANDSITRVDLGDRLGEGLRRRVKQGSEGHGTTGEKFRTVGANSETRLSASHCRITFKSI